jgi:hypothetical protein
MRQGLIIMENGSQAWYKDDRLHREDGPAYVGADGTEEWYFEGKRHRDGGPAITCPDGHQAWYRMGARHREDGPAIIYSDGTKKWLINGEMHRKGGPAIECRDGSMTWLEDGSVLASLTEDYLTLFINPKSKDYRRVNRLIEAGLYANPSEVFHAAISALYAYQLNQGLRKLAKANREEVEL